MSGYTILLLGPPLVQAGGRAISIPRRRVRALLFLLAAVEQPVPRSRLTATLWGDQPDREAARGLSDALYRLRGVLQAESAGPSPRLVAGNDQVSLLLDDSSTIDVRTFEHALVSSIDDSDPIPSLRAAVELWRGPFLDGFDLADCPDFEDWLARERLRIENRYVDALERLCRCYWEAGRAADIPFAAGRLIEVDPLREDAHRWLMRSLAAAGNRSAALRHFESARLLLEEELGVGPEEETLRLRDSIVAGDALGEVSAWPTGPPLDIPTTLQPTRNVVDRTLPFSGREQPFERAEMALNAVLTGHGRTLLLAGEAGIGKSRLIGELLERAKSSTTVLFGECHESTRDLPLQPIVDALRSGLRADRLTKLDVPAYAVDRLRSLLPELPATPSRAKDAVDDGEADLPAAPRRQLFEALTLLIVALAREQPVTIVVDDLHWADDSTVAFLGHLCRHIHDEPVLVLGAYRDNEQPSPLQTIVRELRRGHIAEVILLERLTAEHVGRIVSTLTDQDTMSETVGRWLYEESAGNPFFVAELVTALRDDGILQQHENGRLLIAEFDRAGRLPLPGSVHDLIKARLDRLDANERFAVSVASVASEELDEDLLGAVTGWSEEKAIGCIETLLQAGILRESSDSRFRFAHDKIREVAYAELAAVRRSSLHRRVGETLSERSTSTPGLIAYHFARGRDFRRAFPRAIAAAKQAVDAHANREADSLYTLALDAAERVGNLVAPFEVAAIYEARGRVRIGMSEFATAAADFEQALRLAAAEGISALSLSAGRHLALARFWHHEPVQDALETAHAALAGARALDDRREIAASAAAVAAIVVTRGRLRTGIRMAGEAAAIGRETADGYLTADAVGTLGMAHGWHGMFARARTEIAESLVMAKEGRWGLLVPRALFFSGINAAAIGAFDEAIGFLESCRRYAEESDDVWWLARVPNTIGWVYQERGDLDRSLEYNQTGVDAARKAAWPEPLGNALVNLGVDYLRLGRPDKARATFDDAALLLGRDETMQWRWEIRLLLGLAELYLAIGAEDDSLAFAGRALALARGTGASKHAARARLIQGAAMLRKREPVQARVLLDRAARLAGRLGSPRLQMDTEVLLAETHRRLDDLDRAAGHAATAAGLAASFGLRPTAPIPG